MPDHVQAYLQGENLFIEDDGAVQVESGDP